MRTLLLFSALLLSSPFALLACGSSDTTTQGAGGGDDGRYHPPSNGQHETEADACSALSTAYGARFKALSCVGTTRGCPDFLQSQFGTDCHEYDQGTVQGCIDYYGKQTTCDDLRTSIDRCAVTPYACK